MKKLKSSIKALNPDITFVLFAIFTAVAVGIRTYQLQYIFEPDTGFYYMEMKHSFTIPLLYAVVAASCVVFLAFSYLSKGLEKPKPLGEKNYFIATASLIFSVTLVIDGMMRFSELFNDYADAASSSLSDFLISSRGFPQLFEMIFALFAALYFIIVALSFYTGRQAYVSARVLSLMPVCWLMCRLIGRFVRAVSFIHVSELFWELVMIVFLMLFFMGFARIMSGIGNEGKLPLTMGAGLCGAMVAFMVSLSRIITYFVASEEYLSADSPIELCDFGAALVAIMFLLSCIHDLSPKEEPETPAQPAPVKPAADDKTEKQKKDEEAFLIAEQYANRYITEDLPKEPAPKPDDAPVASAGVTVVPPVVSAGSADEAPTEKAPAEQEPAEPEPDNQAGE